MRARLRALSLALALQAGAAVACESVELRIEVERHEPRAGHQLHAVGSLPVLGPWHPTEANRFERQADGRWRLTLSLPPDTPFEFKLLQTAGREPLWESHQLTPSNNRHARSPACGASTALRIPAFDLQPSPWDLARRATAFEDRPLPASLPAGVQALTEALQSQDPAQRRARLQQAVDPVALPGNALHERLEALVANTGGLRAMTLRRYAGLDDATWVLMTRARHFGQALPVLLRVGADGRLTGLGLPYEALRVTAPTEPPLTGAALQREARALVERACRSGAFSGAVEVAERGKVLFRHACGFANRRYDVPNRVDTRFNLASANKMFTAVALLQLAEQGALSLDDPLDRHLGPEWLAPEVARTITLRQLLAHRSGLGSYFNEAFFQASRDRFRELADFQALVKDEKPEFLPGEHFAYSNTGFLLLGAVLERRGQGGYFGQVQRQVFDRAGMARAGYEPMDVPVRDLAMHYVPGRPGDWVESTWSHVYRGGPAGGGYASVGDLTRFAAALHAGALLRPASQADAWPRDGRFYGFGFELGWSGAGFVVGHSGGFPGINAQFDLYPDSGFSVAALANTEGGGASQLAMRMGELIARLRR